MYTDMYTCMHIYIYIVYTHACIHKRQESSQSTELLLFAHALYLSLSLSVSVLLSCIRAPLALPGVLASFD